MPAKGQHHSPETIERIKEAMRGRKLALHHRAAISRGMVASWARRWAQQRDQMLLEGVRQPKRFRDRRPRGTPGAPKRQP
jgi:hypothetical protein